MEDVFFDKFRVKELTYKEYRYWIVSVRPSQPTIGSLVISLKRHCAKMSDLYPEEATELSLVFSEVERALKNAFSFDKINYLCLMMVDNQLHFHVIPRYENVVNFAGDRYIDKAWPGPIDILSTIDEPNLEIKILEHLKAIESSRSKIIGYTTGVFDLFHIGHLNILSQAKAQCDYLIVGVTTDDLCFQQKNKNPVIEWKERMSIVQAIRYVDKVVPQESMDKFAAWEMHRFDRMFVGSDWKGTEKWNQIEKDFAVLGTEIIYFPYTDSTSSSMMREVLAKIIQK